MSITTINAYAVTRQRGPAEPLGFWRTEKPARSAGFFLLAPGQDGSLLRESQYEPLSFWHHLPQTDAAAMNCVHGLDTRFCAVCNRSREVRRPRRSLGDASLEEILQFLNHAQVRATYRAVAEVLGVIPRSMEARLGIRRPEASWIVNAFNGLPTDYSEDEWHPALLRQAEIISSGRVLALQLSKWRGGSRKV